MRELIASGAETTSRYKRPFRNSGHFARRKHLRIRLLAQDPHCWYCGGFLELRWSTIDHLVPVSHGGSDEEENMRLCCRRCNKRKSNFPIRVIAAPLKRGYGIHIPKFVVEHIIGEPWLPIHLETEAKALRLQTESGGGN